MLQKMRKKCAAAFLLSCLMILSAASCSGEKNRENKASEQESTVIITSDQKSEETKTDKNGEVYILYTSDVHCGIDQGFGYAGLKQMRDSLEAKGYETILVDDGDSLQGEFVGTMDKGKQLEELVDAFCRISYRLLIFSRSTFSIISPILQTFLRYSKYAFTNGNSSLEKTEFSRK